MAASIDRPCFLGLGLLHLRTVPWNRSDSQTLSEIFIPSSFTRFQSFSVGSHSSHQVSSRHVGHFRHSDDSRNPWKFFLQGNRLSSISRTPIPSITLFDLTSCPCPLFSKSISRTTITSNNAVRIDLLHVSSFFKAIEWHFFPKLSLFRIRSWDSRAQMQMMKLGWSGAWGL